MQTHVDERAARAPDALIEGFTHHNALGGVVVGREEILRRVRAVS